MKGEYCTGYYCITLTHWQIEAVIIDNDSDVGSDNYEHHHDKKRRELSCNDKILCHSFRESNSDQISKTYEAWNDPFSTSLSMLIILIPEQILFIFTLRVVTVAGLVRSQDRPGPRATPDM